MGPVITDPRYPKDPQQHPRRQKRDPKMCNPQQQSPPQNAAWQGVYPDLSALNELFSTHQATAANAGQPSPWIGFLASLGLQPISGGQNQQQQQQARPEQEQPSAPPAPEPERQEGQAYAGTNSAAWGQPQHQACPEASQQPRGHSCLLLRCSSHPPTPPDDHQPPPPLLLGRHQGLRHLLLHHRLPLLPLQPPWLPHPVRPLRGARHLSPPHALAHRARRPPALLRHLLPPPCLRPLPPPALPAQAACSRPAPGRSH